VIRRIASGGPWEDTIGYSRAVVAGPFVLVSGCTSLADGAYAQTLAAIEVAEQALARAGVGRADVVRTRMYLTEIAFAEEVGRAHRGGLRPDPAGGDDGGGGGPDRSADAGRG